MCILWATSGSLSSAPACDGNRDCAMGSLRRPWTANFCAPSKPSPLSLFHARPVLSNSGCPILRPLPSGGFRQLQRCGLEAPCLPSPLTALTHAPQCATHPAVGPFGVRHVPLLPCAIAAAVQPHQPADLPVARSLTVILHGSAICNPTLPCELAPKMVGSEPSSALAAGPLAQSLCGLERRPG